MTSSVSYTRAAQIAVVSLAAGLYWNQDEGVTALALAVLGSATAEIAGRVINFMKKPQYKIGAFRSFDPAKNQLALLGALERIKKEYPDQFKLYQEKTKLTETELVGHFQKKLQEGCCGGSADAIFDRIHRHQNYSLRESASQIKDEDVYYFQLLSTFRFGLLKKDENELARRIYNEGLQLIQRNEGALPVVKLHFQETTKLNTEWDNQKKLCEELTQNCYFRHFEKSDLFLADCCAKRYRKALAKVMEKFPGEQDFVGVLDLPQHVLSFQYGPNGYFIYDSYGPSKGLFEYPNEEAFFQELVKHAMYDITHIKPGLMKEKQPDMPDQLLAEMTKEQVEKYHTHFCIRPLSQLLSIPVEKKEGKIAV
jgi:hypothetical protein